MSQSRILFGILFLFYSGVRAQQLRMETEYLKPGHAFFMLGSSIPVQDFGASEYDNLKSGYAQNGIIFQGGAAYEPAPYFGIRISYFYTSHPFNVSQLQTDWQTHAPTGISVNQLSIQDYTFRSMTFGVYYPLRLFRTTLSVGVDAGFANANLPRITYTYISATAGTFFIEHTEGEANDPVYSGYLQVRHKIYKNLLVCASLNYTYSSQSFSDLRILNHTRQTGIYTNDYTQYFQMVWLQAGLAYAFD